MLANYTYKISLITSHIHVYKKRREAMRLKYPLIRDYPLKYPPEYHTAVKRINIKIKIWSKQLKKLQMTNNKVIALGNIVAYFMGINPRNIGKTVGNQRAWETRAFFYKMGIEMKFEQKLLREYVGGKRILQPTEDRSKLNKLLRTDKVIQEKWGRFKKYYEEFPVATDDFIDNRRTPGA